MKKTILFISAMLFSVYIFAQKSTEIAASKLPQATTDYIKDNLPGTKIDKAYKVEDKGVVTYNVTIDVKGKKHLLIFDKDGKFLKKGDDLIKSGDATKTATPPAKQTADSAAKEKPKTK
jgi:hypothetical protein